MSEPSPEALQALLELAQVDGEIRRLRRTLDDLPEQRRIGELAEEIETVREQRGDLTLERDAAQAEASRLDRDVAQLRQRLAAEQQRLYGGEITNAKELQSMRAEIESVQRRIEDHENLELEAMERVEEVESRMTALDDRLATLDEETATVTATRDEAAQHVIVEIAEHEVIRDKQHAALPPELATAYAAAAERHHGVAVGRLDGDRCTACGISLSYADVNELLEGPPLTSCPSCSRLIVIL